MTQQKEKSSAQYGALRRQSALIRIWPIPVILLAATQCVLTGWGKWGDLMVDTGRELEWPRRILHGETLYSDLRFNYGPLSPYLNSLLYRLFGVHLEVLAAAGVLSSILAGLTLYALARRFISRLGATAVVLAFFYICAFSHYDRRGIFNWVLPHTFAATYGMLAALLSLYFLVLYVHERRSVHQALSAFFLGIAALCKVEAFFPALVAYSLWFFGTDRAARRRAVPATLGAAALVTIVYGAFFLRVGLPLWHDNLAGVANPGSDFFIKFVMGFPDFPVNLLKLTIGLAFLVGAVGAGLGVARLVEHKKFNSRVKISVLALAMMLAAVGFSLAIESEPAVLLRTTPLIAATAFLTLLWKWVKSPSQRDSVLPDLIVWAFALACLPRILLRATPEIYGYFLLPSAILGLGIFFFGYLPRLRTDPWGRRALTLVGLSIILSTAVASYRVSLGNLEDKTVVFETSRGTMKLLPVVADMFLPLLKRVESSPPETRLLVLPEASAINFLVERKGVDGMFSHLPMDYYGGFTEEAILARYKKSPPDLILFHDVLMPQFGGARYCLTYGKKICTWMIQNYEPLTDPREDAVLLAPRGK